MFTVGVTGVQVAKSYKQQTVKPCYILANARCASNRIGTTCMDTFLVTIQILFPGCLQHMNEKISTSVSL